MTASVVRHNRYANCNLTGATIEGIDAVGKHLLIRIVGSDRQAVTIHSHLRMSGRWTIGVPPRTAVHRRRIELHLEDDRRLVGTDLPMLHIGRRSDERLWIGHLGPDLCAATFDAATATTHLSTDARPLGQALLDQRVLAGIGILYAVELPFLVGASPFATCQHGAAVDLDRARRLLRRHRTALYRLDDSAELHTPSACVRVHILRADPVHRGVALGSRRRRHRGGSADAPARRAARGAFVYAYASR